MPSFGRVVIEPSDSLRLGPFGEAAPTPLGLGHAARLDGVDRARHHQQDGVAQGADEGQVGDVALEDAARRRGILSPLLAVVHHRVRRVHREPHEDPQQLHRDEGEGDDELGGGRDEPGKETVTDVSERRGEGAMIPEFI
ncbi:hypothetical protein EYF80_032341 [Liparis tanakae]|uniref:Uncharacterized protein n=1 Tax=Liparis tanakae TaxID=230148 RepID=A0A4Z2GXD2_9TELE|nr:hypothetical protein EYF80_032341 [Liparis tanakae]